MCETYVECWNRLPLFMQILEIMGIIAIILSLLWAAWRWVRSLVNKLSVKIYPPFLLL